MWDLYGKVYFIKKKKIFNGLANGVNVNLPLRNWILKKPTASINNHLEDERTINIDFMAKGTTTFAMKSILISTGVSIANFLGKIRCFYRMTLITDIHCYGTQPAVGNELFRDY